MSSITNFTGLPAETLAKAGPLTPEGKPAQSDAQQSPFRAAKIGSSMNALKHGFSSKKIIVMPGQENDFQKLHSGLLAEVRPEGALEIALFQQLLRDAWTIHRVELQQVAMADSGIDPMFDPSCEKQFDRLERYHARYQGGFNKSLRQLRTLQTNRIVQSLLPEPLGLGSLPATVQATQIVALAKRTHKYWNAMAINTLIAATKRSKADFSAAKEPSL